MFDSKSKRNIGKIAIFVSRVMSQVYRYQTIATVGGDDLIAELRDERQGKRGSVSIVTSG